MQNPSAPCSGTWANAETRRRSLNAQKGTRGPKNRPTRQAICEDHRQAALAAATRHPLQIRNLKSAIRNGRPATPSLCPWRPIRCRG